MLTAYRFLLFCFFVLTWVKSKQEIAPGNNGYIKYMQLETSYTYVVYNQAPGMKDIFRKQKFSQLVCGVELY